jgi:hypothetical protein
MREQIVLYQSQCQRCEYCREVCTDSCWGKSGILEIRIGIWISDSSRIIGKVAVVRPLLGKVGWIQWRKVVSKEGIYDFPLPCWCGNGDFRRTQDGRYWCGCSPIPVRHAQGHGCHKKLRPIGTVILARYFLGVRVQFLLFFSISMKNSGMRIHR